MEKDKMKNHMQNQRENTTSGDVNPSSCSSVHNLGLGSAFIVVGTLNKSTRALIASSLVTLREAGGL